MNGKLVELADKDSIIYEEAPPILFGDKEVKEREDQLQALDRATGHPQFQRFQIFRTTALKVSAKGTPRGCFQPYQFRATRGKLHPEGERKEPVKKGWTEEVTN